MHADPTQFHHQEQTMKTLQHHLAAATAALALFGAGAPAQAATATLYGARADFLAALGGASTVSQDFEGYASGTNLSGVQVLPGVTMSTNLSSLDVFNSPSLGQIAFATSRNQPEALYDIALSGGYKAFGFDIAGYDPNTPGPGFLSFYFADGDLSYTLIPVLPNNATETTPLFFGVISDQAVVGVRWSEGPEIGGINCCEETGLDNLIAAAPVPEPGSGALLFGGLGAGAWLVRRRRIAADRA
jgi:hypothetical protein